MRKVFLDDLPRKMGKGANKNKLVIDWKQCIGQEIKFIYDDIEGILKINHCKNNYLIVQYKNKEFKIYSRCFMTGQLGRILGKITHEFKIRIGTIIKDDKRDLIIIDEEYRTRTIKNKRYKDRYYKDKYYKYKCNNCGWDEGWMAESALLKGQGCSCCNNQIVVEGINDIPTTAPWMVKYFQGGYDEAKLYTRCSNQKIYPICPECGRIKDKAIFIGNIHKNHSIGCICNDNISYPEKIMCSVLEQLHIDFKTQLSKINFKWCDKYKYDFCFIINNEMYVIETHGRQHYEEGFQRIKTGKHIKSLEEEQKNDKTKKELALTNNIKEENYIVIDCRYSELEFIKDNILHSRLNELFNLSQINWLKCEEFACHSLIKEVCNLKKENPDMSNSEIGELVKIEGQTVLRYLKQGTKLGWYNYKDKKELQIKNILIACNLKKENPELTTTQIGDTMKLNKTTICVYLKQGTKLKLCDYNPSEEKTRLARIQGYKKTGGKQIEIFKNNKSLGTFSSCNDLSKQSEKLFGAKLFSSGISATIKGKQNTYKGFTFKYI